MKHSEHISIGKLRQAYRLNMHDADVLLSALASQRCLDLYALWHEAVRFVAVEENNKKSIYDEVADPYFPDMSDMGNGPLEGRILTKRLLRHFLYAAKSGAPRERLQGIFERVLHFTYDDPDEQQNLSVNHLLDIMYEQRHFSYHGKDKVDIGWEYIRPELFAAFCTFFDDAIFANKQAAVVWLDEHGYSQERSVKGLSIELAKRILAAHTAASQSVQNSQPANTPAKASSKPTTAPIVVPRALWLGLEEDAAIANLKAHTFSKIVIAYVLYHWCGFTNKTDLGKKLSDSEKESSTYLHAVDRLLKKAAELTIITDE